MSVPTWFGYAGSGRRIMWAVGIFTLLLVVRHVRSLPIIPDAYTVTLGVSGLVMLIYLKPHRLNVDAVRNLDRDEESTGS